jgi:GNAT superfamily N-acetyltransferase
VTEGEPRLEVRDMTESDLADGLRLSRASGWNQTLADWRLLLSLGPGLFRVALLDGRVAASGGAVRYGDARAWICMILVDPQERGHGLGTRIFDEVLGRCDAEVKAGHLRCVGLDATPAGRGIYLQRGFVEGPPPSALVRMRAEPATAERKGSGLELCPVRESTIQDLTPAVRPLAGQLLEGVLARDREVFGADRSPVLRRAHASAPDLAWTTPSGDYCFGRHGDHSDHVGPVVAGDRESALALVRACLSDRRGRPLILDARADPEWLAALGGLGFGEQRPFTRMYLGGARCPARPELEAAVFGTEFG